MVGVFVLLFGTIRLASEEGVSQHVIIFCNFACFNLRSMRFVQVSLFAHCSVSDGFVICKQLPKETRVPAPTYMLNHLLLLCMLLPLCRSLIRYCMKSCFALVPVCSARLHLCSVLRTCVCASYVC